MNGQDHIKPLPMLDLRREYEYMKVGIDAAIQRCLGHQKWILGPEVQELEERIARYLDVKHAIGASSGTDALVLALRALAIKLKGQEYFDKADQIITTPFTFTATGDAILRVGASPVFVDIDPQTYNIDPNLLREYVVHSKSARAKNHVRVVGTIPVHLYGLPCQMKEIMSVADEHGMFTLEDVAQAFGASYKDNKLGSLGICGAFSFFPSKNLGGFGDAGMISTNDGEIADLIRMLIKHGGKDKYNVDHVGYNARIDTLQAAVLLEKLKHVDEFNALRRDVAARYSSGLKGVEGIVMPLDDSRPGAPPDHVFHQFTIRVLYDRRDALRDHLKRSGIESMVYYPVPLNQMKVFKGKHAAYGDLGAAERAAGEVLSLPIEPLMTSDETTRVVEGIREFFAEKEHT